MYWILIIFALVMFFRTWLQVRRNGETARIMKVMDHFQEEDKFFELADQEIASNPKPEFQNKTRVLRLFGDAAYKRHDEFMKDLQELDLKALYVQNNKVSLEYNEDSFYYLFMAVPNKLYSVGDPELIDPLYEKLDQDAEVLDKLLVSKLGHEAKKYYLKEGDLGKPFFEGMLEGDYAGYKYSPQLIGMYKDMVGVLLARMALDEGDMAKYESFVPDMKAFTASGLGKRWIKELGIVLPEDPKEEDEEPEEPEEINEAEETAPENEETPAEATVPEEAPAEEVKKDQE